MKLFQLLKLQIRQSNIPNKEMIKDKTQPPFISGDSPVMTSSQGAPPFQLRFGGRIPWNHLKTSRGPHQHLWLGWWVWKRLLLPNQSYHRSPPPRRDGSYWVRWRNATRIWRPWRRLLILFDRRRDSDPQPYSLKPTTATTGWKDSPVESGRSPTRSSQVRYRCWRSLILAVFPLWTNTTPTPNHKRITMVRTFTYFTSLFIYLFILLNFACLYKTSSSSLIFCLNWVEGSKCQINKRKYNLEFVRLIKLV